MVIGTTALWPTSFPRQLTIKQYVLSLKLTKPKHSIKRHSVEDRGFPPKKCWPADLATHGQIRTSGREENAQGKHERMRQKARKASLGQNQRPEGVELRILRARCDWLKLPGVAANQGCEPGGLPAGILESIPPAAAWRDQRTGGRDWPSAAGHRAAGEQGVRDLVWACKDPGVSQTAGMRVGRPINAAHLDSGFGNRNFGVSFGELVLATLWGHHPRPGSENASCTPEYPVDGLSKGLERGLHLARKARRIPGTGPSLQGPCLEKTRQASGELPGCDVGPLSLRLPALLPHWPRAVFSRGSVAVTDA